MTISKELRYATVLFLVIYIVNNYLSIQNGNVQSDTVGSFLFDISVTVISMVLLAIYFGKRQFWLPFCGIILLDLFNLYNQTTEFFNSWVLFENQSLLVYYGILTLLLYLFYGLSFIIFKARHHFWLSAYGIIFLIIFVLNIVFWDTVTNENNYKLFAHLNNFTTIVLLLHFLMPDRLRQKPKTRFNGEVIDDLE